MTWTTLRVIPGRGRDAVVAALFEAGAMAVQEDGGAVITSFPGDIDMSAVCAAVKAADPTAMVATTALPDIDWSEAWRDRLTSHAVGGLTITPPWLAAGLEPGRTYQLSYRVRDLPVAGTGLVAFRDTASWLKHQPW